MNSEINNNLALSSVTLVKTESGSLNNSTSQPPANPSQPVGNALQPAANSSAQSAAKPAANSSQDKTNQTPSLKSVKTATEKSNPLLQAMKLSVEYSVDGSTQEIVMKVVDTDSGKVVRQIPSSEMLDFVKRLQDLENQQKGAVIQTRA